MDFALGSDYGDVKIIPGDIFCPFRREQVEILLRICLLLHLVLVQKLKEIALAVKQAHSNQGQPHIRSRF